MRRRLLTLVVVLVVAMGMTPSVLGAEAGSGYVVDSGTCGENVTWTVTDYTTLTISGTGAMDNFNSSSNTPPWYSTQQTKYNHLIENIIIEDGVTSIGDWAFDWCFNAVSVTIPSSVRSIGEFAFSGCRTLESVDIPEGVETLGKSSFSDCRGLKSIAIPATVTTIGLNAFDGCSSLESVSLPDSVTTIGNMAFMGCSSLASVDLPSGLTAIGSGLFEGCSNLASIVIPACVTSIDGSAFKGCSSLDNVVIPAGVTLISNWTFSSCSSLKNVDIPDSVTEIYAYAFQNCTSLASIMLPSSITKIGLAAFGGCENLTIYCKPSATAVIAYANDNSIPYSLIGFVTEITFDRTELSLLVGETAALAATVLPADADDPSLAWASSDPAVAAVDASGTVTAVGAGSATITAAACDGSGVSASCAVTVEEPVQPVLVTEITLDKAAATVSIGKTCTLKATVAPADADDVSITWESSNTSVATVDSQGIVTGKTRGAAVITAKANDGSGVSASCAVTVEEPAAPVTKQMVTKITLDKTSATVAVNASIALKATVTPANATDKTIGWKSSDSKVATVDAKGNVKGVSKGTVTITATAKDGSGKSASCKVTVNGICPAKADFERIVKAWNKNVRDSYGGATGCAAFTRYAFQQLYGHKDTENNENNVVTTYTCKTATDLLNYLKKNAARGDAFRVKGFENGPYKDSKGNQRNGWHATANTHIMILYDIEKSGRISLYDSRGKGKPNTAKSDAYKSALALAKTVGGQPRVSTYFGDTNKYVKLTIIHAKENKNTNSGLAINQNIKVTVSFGANGGQVSPASKTVQSGGTYGTLPTPTKSGFQFDGWYTAKSGGQKVTASSIVSSAANHALYAHWTCKTHSYKDGICTKCGYEWPYSVTSLNGVKYKVTKKDGSPIWSRPYASNATKYGVMAKGSIVSAVGKTTNKDGKKWYLLSDGSWIISDNVSEVNQGNVRYACNTDGALVMRSGKSSSTKQLALIPEGAAVIVDTSKSSTSWLSVTYNGKSGYASSKYLTTTAPKLSVYKALKDVAIKTKKGSGKQVGNIKSGDKFIVFTARSDKSYLWVMSTQRIGGYIPASSGSVFR